MTNLGTSPFIAELRRELRQTAPILGDIAAIIGASGAGGAEWNESVDSYIGQLSLIEQTSRMIGLAGLGEWCSFLSLSLSGTASGGASPEIPQRELLGQHLMLWPALADQYLSDTSSFDHACSLADYLMQPVFAQPLSNEDGMTMIDLLATEVVLPDGLAAQVELSLAAVTVNSGDTDLSVPENVDADVYHTFLDEAPSSLELFGSLAVKISSGNATAEDFRSAKRIAHSCKGSANIVGVRGVAVLSHHTEDILEYLETSQAKPSRSLSHTLMAAGDCLAQMVGFLRGEEPLPESSMDILRAVVDWSNKVKTGDIAEALAAEADNESASAALPAPAAIAPSSRATHDQGASAETANEAGSTLRVPVFTMDEIVRLSGELTAQTVQLETQAAGLKSLSKSIFEHHLLIQQRVTDIEKLVMLRGMSGSSRPTDNHSSFDPLEMDRYNEMHAAAHALVEVTADAREMLDVLENSTSKLKTEAAQHAAANSELQYQIFATRLAPVHTLSARLTRNIRQTCMQTGKQAELSITGGDIQVDGDVLNKLADPLLHLLRNAVDHGIEPPIERSAAGKSETGHISLDFSRQGSGIIVTLTDDGSGLDYDRIRQKAMERELIMADANLSRAELARLILLPGFSTKDQVSEISGRGVGMDVVASRLSSIKGTVDISSDPGLGCKITLRFQASLVTQDILLVESCGQAFAIPIHHIREVFPGGSGTEEKNPNPASIGCDPGCRFTIRDEHLPLHSLASLAGQIPSSGDIQGMPKLLIHAHGEVFAVAVDSVTDCRNVMVKPMGKYLPLVHGVLGVTITGDGGLVPLLNLPELLSRPVATPDAVASLAAAARLKTRRVLVVDDSLSVRKGLIQMLQDASYEVKGAADGMDAIRTLKTFHPHLVCTDMEMPNMNGIELAQHLRMEDATRDIPIIMITSRSTEKHREQAARAGVNFYLTKPYTDSDLLLHVQEALREHTDMHGAQACAG